MPSVALTIERLRNRIHSAEKERDDLRKHNTALERKVTTLEKAKKTVSTHLERVTMEKENMPTTDEECKQLITKNLFLNKRVIALEQEKETLAASLNELMKKNKTAEKRAGEKNAAVDVYQSQVTQQFNRMKQENEVLKKQSQHHALMMQENELLKKQLLAVQAQNQFIAQHARNAMAGSMVWHAHNPPSWLLPNNMRPNGSTDHGMSPRAPATNGMQPTPPGNYQASFQAGPLTRSPSPNNVPNMPTMLDHPNNLISQPPFEGPVTAASVDRLAQPQQAGLVAVQSTATPVVDLTAVDASPQEADMHDAERFTKAGSQETTASTATSRASTSTTASSTRKPNGRSAWSAAEDNACIRIMTQLVNARMLVSNRHVHFTVDSMWTRVSDELAKLGFERSASAVKLQWTRRLRAKCGVDERISPNPSQMRTGLLAPSKRSIAGGGLAVKRQKRHKTSDHKMPHIAGFFDKGTIEELEDAQDDAGEE